MNEDWIYITTEISLSDFFETYQKIMVSLKQADLLNIIISTETVARTYCYDRYSEWFFNQEQDLERYMSNVEDQDGDHVCQDPELIGQDDESIFMNWSFFRQESEEESLALLFKLTHGGL